MTRGRAATNAWRHKFPRLTGLATRHPVRLSSRVSSAAIRVLWQLKRSPLLNFDSNTLAHTSHALMPDDLLGRTLQDGADNGGPAGS